MKILFLASDLRQLGGIQNYNKKFISTLRDLGVDVVLLEMKGLSLISKALFTLRFFLRCLFLWPHLTIVTNINFSPLALLANELLGRPYTITVYGTDVEKVTSLYRTAIERARCIIALFRATADYLVDQVEAARTKIVFIPNFIDGDKFFIKQRSLTIIDRHGLAGKKIIMTLARLSALDGDNKGYERVVRAMPDILKKVPHAIYLLAGGGDDIPRVKAVARGLGVEKNVLFTGPISDREMLDYYSSIDVFVLPSKREGFPAIVLLEALACGKPVVAGRQSRADGATIFNGEVGSLVPPDDVSAIGDALVRILRGDASPRFYDPEFLRRRVLEVYGKEPYARAVRHFLSSLTL